MRKVVWNTSALQQLHDACDYIRERFPQGADKVKEKIVEKINHASLHPETFPPDRYKKSNPGNCYRAFTVYNYRVSYYIKNSEIIIIRVRHTAMAPLDY